MSSMSMSSPFPLQRFLPVHQYPKPQSAQVNPANILDGRSCCEAVHTSTAFHQAPAQRQYTWMGVKVSIMDFVWICQRLSPIAWSSSLTTPFFPPRLRVGPVILFNWVSCLAVVFIYQCSYPGSLHCDFMALTDQLWCISLAWLNDGSGSVEHISKKHQNFDFFIAFWFFRSMIVKLKSHPLPAKSTWLF